jgi:hypothetical protein
VTQVASQLSARRAVAAVGAASGQRLRSQGRRSLSAQTRSWEGHGSSRIPTRLSGVPAAGLGLSWPNPGRCRRTYYPHVVRVTRCATLTPTLSEAHHHEVEGTSVHTPHTRPERRSYGDGPITGSQLVSAPRGLFHPRIEGPRARRSVMSNFLRRWDGGGCSSLGARPLERTLRVSGRANPNPPALYPPATR